MSVILHIGTHKTGTTLLQRFADKHRNRLQKAGLEYPDWKTWSGVRSHYAHHDLAHAVADNSRVIDRRKLDRFCAKLRDISSSHDVLLSAEPLYRYVINDHRSARASRNAYVQRLSEWMRGLDITVLVLYRRPDDFAASMYGEHVLQTRFSGTMERFIQQRPYLFDYAWQNDLFERNIGKVMNLCYERLKVEGLIDGFFSRLGIDVSGWERPETANTSRDPALIELKRRANEEPAGNVQEKMRLRRIDALSLKEVMPGEENLRPRSLWESEKREQEFMERWIAKFRSSKHWDASVFDEPWTRSSPKVYRSEWIEHLNMDFASSV